MEIRSLTHRDAATYHALRLRMLQLYPDAFTSSFEEDSQKPLSWVEQRIAGEGPSDFVLGAYRGDGLVGAVGLTVEAKLKQRHKALLFGMYVAPEHAQQGIGRALLDECLSRARRIEGLEQINLTVTSTNARALRLYEAAGFRTFGIEERAIRVAGEYHAKAHMTLRLRNDR